VIVGPQDLPADVGVGGVQRAWAGNLGAVIKEATCKLVVSQRIRESSEVDAHDCPAIARPAYLGEPGVGEHGKSADGPAVHEVRVALHSTGT